MRLNPGLEEKTALLPKLDMSDVKAARAEFERIIELRRAQPAPEWAVGVDIESRSVPGPGDAPDVPVYIVRPYGVTDPGALVYLHGGGFTIGTAESTLPVCALFARAAGIVVVTVDYRLAPEDPYPAAVNDSYAALQWVAANAEDLGVDRQRIGIGGASAGGSLAAGAALMARDRGGQALAHMFLEFPSLDYKGTTWSARNITTAPLLTSKMMQDSQALYFRDVTADVPIYAAPETVEDVAGLPPTYMLACEYDPLRDGELAFARRLLEADVPVELHLFTGTFHGFLALGADISHRALRVAGEALRDALGRPGAER